MTSTCDHQLEIDRPADLRVAVSVIMTVKNDAAGTRQTVESLLVQERQPDEIVIVDGGSTDSTNELLLNLASEYSHIRVVSAPGANIARGRNLAIEAATNEIIAGIDAGCVARPDWLGNLTRPFEKDASVEFVAGMYRIAPQSLFENVVGLATMRGQLDPVDPATFNPSARSVALAKSLWARVGGWPEWLNFSEDTWFDHRVREAGANWHFAENAIVEWRPRGTWRSLAKQFYHYGTGRGLTGIDAASFHYNLRNLLIVATLGIGSIFSPWLIVPLVGTSSYFYVWTFHEKAIKILRRTKSWLAYPMTLAVMLVVLFSNLVGFLVGSTRREKLAQQGELPGILGERSRSSASVVRGKVNNASQSELLAATQ